MDSEDISDVVVEMRSETIASLIAAHCPPGTYPEQWDVAGLKESLDEVLGLQPPVDEWLTEEAVEQELIVERVQALSDAAMAEKTAELEPGRWQEIEKNFLIQTLDHHWKDHLATLDALRQVIHLRSYAQKKPIDEYKQEAFLLFERLLVAIREDVTRMLSRAQVELTPPPLPELPAFLTQHLDPFSGEDNSFDLDAAARGLIGAPHTDDAVNIPLPELPEGALAEPVSRNAPCPCGSGRKFKHCHGQLA
jgi:preprotein translocase subunit SecA